MDDEDEDEDEEITVAPATVVPPRLVSSLLSILSTSVRAAAEGMIAVTTTEPALTVSVMLPVPMLVALAMLSFT